MKPNIHPELYRAMQTAREEDISRVAVRWRAEGHRDRSAWGVLCGRVAAFLERALKDASLTPLADNPPQPK